MTTMLILLGVLIGAMVVARIITKTAAYATTKLCVACQSRVPSAATKCKFCGSDLAV